MTVKAVRGRRLITEASFSGAVRTNLIITGNSPSGVVRLRSGQKAIAILAQHFHELGHVDAARRAISEEFLGKEQFQVAAQLIRCRVHVAETTSTSLDPVLALFFVVKSDLPRSVIP